MARWHLSHYDRAHSDAYAVYLLQKVPPAKWLGINVTLWGIMTACTAAVQNYGGLLAVRILLGVFEATIGPSLMLISSQWYTKSEQAPRFSLWYLGLGVGQIVGGLLSFAFQHIKQEAIAGWRVMFIALGFVTIIIGLATAFFLPDTPMKAKFLSEDDKIMLLKHVSVNQTGIENKRFQWSQVWETFCDLQIWLLVLITILVRIPPFPSVPENSPLTIPGIRLKRRRNNLLRHSHPLPRIQLPKRRAPQHALRHRQYLLHPPGRIRHPPLVPPLGLDRHVQRPRHHRRRPNVLPTFRQHRWPPHRHLPRQLHRRSPPNHLPLDCRQLCRPDETGFRHRHRRGLFLHR